jgi:hypothetical protein
MSQETGAQWGAKDLTSSWCMCALWVEHWAHSWNSWRIDDFNTGGWCEKESPGCRPWALDSLRLGPGSGWFTVFCITWEKYPDLTLLHQMHKIKWTESPCHEGMLQVATCSLLRVPCPPIWNWKSTDDQVPLRRPCIKVSRRNRPWWDLNRA